MDKKIKSSAFYLSFSVVVDLIEVFTANQGEYNCVSMMAVRYLLLLTILWTNPRMEYKSA